MENIEEFFQDLIIQHKSVDIAEAEFKKLVAEDPGLREIYREWCHSVGNSERNGFRDFCREYIESQESIWDSLNDYYNE